MDNKNIIEQINKLTQKTKDKKIDWQIINPNLCRWVRKSSGETFLAVLQKIGSGNNYVLTIQSIGPSETLLNANSTFNPDIRLSLGNLYDAVMQAVSETHLEKLDKFIDTI